MSAFLAVLVVLLCHLVACSRPNDERLNTLVKHDANRYCSAMSGLCADSARTAMQRPNTRAGLHEQGATMAAQRLKMQHSAVDFHNGPGRELKGAHEHMSVHDKDHPMARQTKLALLHARDATRLTNAVYHAHPFESRAALQKTVATAETMQRHYDQQSRRKDMSISRSLSSKRLGQENDVAAALSRQKSL